MKFCNTCQELKPESEFNKDRYKPDGLSTQCRECKKKYKREHAAEIRAYKDKNKEHERVYSRQLYWAQDGKRREYERQYYQLNKLERIMSVGINRGVQNAAQQRQERPVNEFLDYTLAELKSWLESQFIPEMDWNNQGIFWEIDHVIPCNNFKLVSFECRDFKICWSLLNLRPLTISENRTRPQDGSDIPLSRREKILSQYPDLL